ncbi:MAG: ATP-dependent Clp protease proteolytic subunit, partial [Ruminococcus sp.]|nr:ATP-dependent Clp protease proteolytic subunit [Ruminococcus sp.]
SNQNKEEKIMYEFKNQGNSTIFKQSSLPPTVLEETAGGRSPVDVRTLSLEHSILMLSGEITDDLAQEIILVLHICAERGKSLTIYINSPGGSVSAGLAIQDALEDYPYGYDIICCGLAASMAAVLLAGGRKGHRFIMPHSKVMIHEPLISGGLGGSATSIQRTAESIMETKRVLSEMLSRFTGKSIKEIEKNIAYDNFFTAEQAIEFGLCDAIATGFERYANNEKTDF